MVTADSIGDFALALRCRHGAMVIDVVGELDVVSAPTLRRALDVLVDHAQGSVTLDLASLRFMDAAGLRVLADEGAALAMAGHRLALRSAPSSVRRLAALTGVDAVVAFEADGEDELGGEGASASTRSADRYELLSELSRAGSLPASNEVLDGALRLVTALAETSVEGADGVSVSLRRHGRLATVAATNETVREMDRHQYETGQGPCLAAAAEGRWFHVESLSGEQRWPTFVPRALEEGIASILSTPLMAGGRPLGALNIYSVTERAFGPQEQELAALFATQASRLLADAGADRTDEQVANDIATALHQRDTIVRAEGVEMARHGISAEAAASGLWRAARALGVSVAAHAATVVGSTRGEDDDKHA